MSNDIELDDLAKRSIPPNNVPGLPAAISNDEEDGVMALFGLVVAVLSALFATLLTFSPRFLLFAASSQDYPRAVSGLTSLEAFLARHFGIYMYAIAGSALFNIPFTPPVEQRQHNVYWHPLIMPLTAAAAASSFFSHNTSDVGLLSTAWTFINLLVSGFGIWAMLFSGSSHKSRKTGADKRTSRFLFGNKSAASAQKKEWKEQQKRK